MRKYFILIIFSLYLFFPQISHAAEFAFDYDVYYTVLKNGLTQVRQNISVTNLTTQYYAEQFTLSLSSEKITDVKISGNSNTLGTQVTKQKDQTQIVIPFRTPTVGIKKQFSFTVDYKASDIAQKKGRIWEILIPGIEKSESIRTYTVHLTVPPEFGSPAFITPAPQKGGVWTLQEFGGEGIALAFGDFQNFSFNLKYSLENTTSRKQLQEIALPPDTGYQKVLLKQISKTPESVNIDKDGNWMAQYLLLPFGKQVINIQGNVLLYSQSKSPEITLSPEERQLYTKQAKYWEQTEKIATLGKTLKTPKKIYDWVVSTLHYDFTRVNENTGRLGAEIVIDKPGSAVCTEFTDLFIALARSAGIPARSHHGFAFSTNSRLQPLSLKFDVLHAWPEYYDETRKIWIQIDPTWANTTRGVDYFSKLDFNHITFAILGVSSNYPYPAGSYKTDNSTKDVFVDFDEKDIQVPLPKITLTSDYPSLAWPFFKFKGILNVTNSGNVLYPKTLVTADKIFDLENTAISGLPPYAKKEMGFSFTPSFQLFGAKLDYKINVGESQSIVSVSVIPGAFYVVPIFLFIFVLLLLIIKRLPKRHAKKT